MQQRISCSRNVMIWDSMNHRRRLRLRTSVVRSKQSKSVRWASLPLFRSGKVTSHQWPGCCWILKKMEKMNYTPVATMIAMIIESIGVVSITWHTVGYSMSFPNMTSPCRFSSPWGHLQVPWTSLTKGRCSWGFGLAFHGLLVPKPSQQHITYYGTNRNG